MKVQITAGQPTESRPTTKTGAAASATKQPALEPYIGKAEVARRLGKSVRCVDNWMARGLIPFFKIGRTVAFKWSDVESHLERKCHVTWH